MKRIMDILGIIFCTLSICFIIIFSIMIIQLYRYNKCRNSEYTYDYCEKYRDFWKEKTEMKNLINYIYHEREVELYFSSISKLKRDVSYLINLTSLRGVI